MAPRGRPTRLTTKLAHDIADVVASGNHFNVACEYHGVPEGTGHRWLAKGSDPDAPPMYRDFREAVTRARAQAEAGSVARLRQAGMGGQVVERRTVHKADGSTEVIERVAGADWRAEGWFLERSQPKRWGRRLVEVSGPEGEAIPLEVRNTALDRVAQALGLMAERVTAGGELGDRLDDHDE